MTTKRAPAWTSEENAAVVALYFLMRRKVDKDELYNKAAMIRSAQNGHGGGEAYAGLLIDRSRGSIEAKLMNVTAVLHDLDRHDVSMANHGYRPLSNYQADLRLMVVGLLAIRDEAVNGGFSPAVLSA
jgi:hypothetical protein